MSIVLHLPTEDASRPTRLRPKSSQQSRAEDRLADRGSGAAPHARKKKHKFGPQPPRPAFQTTTGEQIHGMWDDDDELL